MFSHMLSQKLPSHIAPFYWFPPSMISFLKYLLKPIVAFVAHVRKLFHCFLTHSHDHPLGWWWVAETCIIVWSTAITVLKEIEEYGLVMLCWNYMFSSNCWSSIVHHCGHVMCCFRCDPSLEVSMSHTKYKVFVISGTHVLFGLYWKLSTLYNIDDNHLLIFQCRS